MKNILIPLMCFAFLLSLQRSSCSKDVDESPFQHLVKIVEDLELKSNGVLASTMVHSPELVEQLFNSPLTKDEFTGTYYLQIEPDNTITVFFPGGRQGKQNVKKSIYRHGKWKLGGQRVSDRFHSYRIKSMLATQFGLPPAEKPSSKYVSLTEVQTVTNQLRLRDKNGYLLECSPNPVPHVMRVSYSHHGKENLNDEETKTAHSRANRKKAPRR